MKCETVKVIADTKSGFKLINQSDFDENIHKLYVEKQTRKRK